MKTNILVLTLCVFTFVTCKKDETIGIKGSFRNVGISFYVQNADGANLVSPQTPNYLKPSDLKLYYINENQEKVLFYNELMDGPTGFVVSPTYDVVNIPGDKLVIGAGLQSYLPTNDPSKKCCINYIEWPNGEVDKIEGKFHIEPEFISLIEVKINGEMMWTTNRYNSGIDKDGQFALFNKVITDNGSTIKLFTDYTYRP